MLIIQKLEEMQELSGNEKEVAKYLITHQHKISKLSINDIAKATYTSPSTTVRLSKKLGYEGWKELKGAIVDELKYIHDHFEDIDPNYPFNREHTNMEIVNRIGSLLSNTIIDTMNLIDHDILQKSVLLLSKAENIYVYGITNAIGVAYDFKYSMRTIGKKVTIIENLDEFPYTIYATTSHDVSIFISYSGENEELLSSAAALHSKHLPIISITSIGDNTLSRLSDYVFYMTTRERLYSKINNYTSKESTSYILNILFSCIFASNYKYNLETKMNLSRQIDTKRSSTIEIMKEK